MELTGRIVNIGSRRVAEFEGEVDLATLPRFRDLLIELVDQGPGEIAVIDLDGLSVLDDAGLGVVLGIAARARSRGGDLVVVCSGDRLRKRLTDSRLDRAVDVFATVAETAATR